MKQELLYLFSPCLPTVKIKRQNWKDFAFAHLGLALRQFISQTLRSSEKILEHMSEPSLGLLLEALPWDKSTPDTVLWKRESEEQ